MQPIRRILLPTDGSVGSRAAGKLAAQMARDLGARIDVLTVVDTSSVLEAFGDVAGRSERVGEIRALARERALRFVQRHFAEVAAWRSVGATQRSPQPSRQSSTTDRTDARPFGRALQSVKSVVSGAGTGQAAVRGPMRRWRSTAAKRAMRCSVS
jgi:Universal stress protein family